MAIRYVGELTIFLQLPGYCIKRQDLDEQAPSYTYDKNIKWCSHLEEWSDWFIGLISSTGM